MDFIQNARDLSDTKYETQLDGVREIPVSVDCWICGIHKSIQTSSISNFDIFDDGLPSYQVNGVLCYGEKPHFAGLKVAGRWWNIEEILCSKSTSR